MKRQPETVVLPSSYEQFQAELAKQAIEYVRNQDEMIRQEWQRLEHLRKMERDNG